MRSAVWPARAPQTLPFFGLSAREYLRAGMEVDRAIAVGEDPQILHPFTRSDDALAGDHHAFVDEAVWMMPQHRALIGPEDHI